MDSIMFGNNGDTYTMDGITLMRNGRMRECHRRDIVCNSDCAQFHTHIEGPNRFAILMCGAAVVKIRLQPQKEVL